MFDCSSLVLRERREGKKKNDIADEKKSDMVKISAEVRSERKKIFMNFSPRDTSREFIATDAI